MKFDSLHYIIFEVKKILGVEAFMHKNVHIVEIDYAGVHVSQLKR